jgi:hypothetical protein
LMGNMQRALCLVLLPAVWAFDSGSLLEQVTGDMRVAAGVSVFLLLILWRCFKSGRHSQVTVVFKRLDAAGLQQLSATVAAAVAEAKPSANDEALQRIAASVERLKTLQYQFQNDIIKAHEQIWQGLCNLKEQGESRPALQPLPALTAAPTEPSRAEEFRKPPSKPASRKISETMPEEQPKPETAPEELPRPPVPAKLPVRNTEVPAVKQAEPALKLEEPPKPTVRAPEPIPKTDDSPGTQIKPLEPTKKVEESPKPAIKPPEPAKEFPRPPLKLPGLPKKLDEKPPKAEETKQPPEEAKKEGEAPPGRPAPPMRKPGVARPKFTPPTTLGNPFGAK